MNRKHVLINNWKTIILAAVSLFLFIIPFFSGKGYSVGGDDSRLYYLYPLEYLNNFLFQVISANQQGVNLGYYAVSYSAPVITIIAALKAVLPAVNVQQLLYGLNISLGFLFSYLFFSLWSDDNERYIYVANIFCALLYVTSPYLVHSLYQSQLIPIYLVMLTPAILYLLTRGVRENNMKFIAAAALIYTLFSSTLLSLPWFYPFMIVFVPYIIFLVILYKKVFWKSVAVFGGIVFATNIYWLIHGVVSTFSVKAGSTLATSLMSNTLKNQNDDVIKSLVYLNTPIHQIAGYLRTSWTDYKDMQSVALVGSIPIFIISSAGIVVKKAKRNIATPFVISLCCYLLALLFITPNFGAWNLDLFLFLNHHLPFFTILRNMYDKFGLALAFTAAWSLSCAFTVLRSTITKRWLINALFVLAILVIVFNGQQFVVAQLRQGEGNRITAFSDDFRHLIDFIKSQQTAKRYVWYPMTFPGYVALPDATTSNEWYLGLSPVQILAGRSDLAGFYGLQTPLAPEENWRILDMLQKGDDTKVAQILAGYNVGYVITYNQPFPDRVRNQLEQFSFLSSQNDSYKASLFGPKVKDFGTSYSLYEVRPEYQFGTVFLTDSGDVTSPKQEIPYEKLSDGSYMVSLPKPEFQKLVLLEPYHSLWSVGVEGDNAHSVTLTHHVPVFSYGNLWTIQADSKTVYPVRLHIRFIPNDYTKPAVIVSIIAFIITLAYILGIDRLIPKNHET